MNTEEDQKRLDEAHDAIVRAGARCEETEALRAQLAASGKMAEDMGTRLQQTLTEADALRERVRVLEEALREVIDAAGELIDAPVLLEQHGYFASANDVEAVLAETELAKQTLSGSAVSS